MLFRSITGNEMAVRAGDHHDGMYYFGLNAAGALDRNGSDRGVIAINFENISLTVISPTMQPERAPESREV